jgi:hypothetical protein
MGTMAESASQLPVWTVIAFWVYMAYRFLSAARAEDRRRLEEGQPHTRRDTVLLLLSGLCVAGGLLCVAFFKPLMRLASSRLGMTAAILVVGGGLTYVFNRRRASHSR